MPEDRSNLDQKHILRKVLARLETLENELNQIRSEADASAHLATLGLLSATVAHELRNVLTPVLTYAQWAQSHVDDHDLTRKALDKTVDGVRTAAEILQSTLDYAGSASNSCDSAANVQQVVGQAFVALVRRPEQDRIITDLNIEEGVYVAMRPLALQQILMNLILNGMRAMARKSPPAGGHRLRIDASRADGDVGRVEIIVSDTGPGFDPSIADTIFEPFVSSEQSSSSAMNQSSESSDCRGTGLGLAICRRLTLEAGGTIEARSVPGEGATFVLDLPVARPSHASDDPNASTPHFEHPHGLRKAG